MAFASEIFRVPEGRLLVAAMLVALVGSGCTIRPTQAPPVDWASGYHDTYLNDEAWESSWAR